MSVFIKSQHCRLFFRHTKTSQAVLISVHAHHTNRSVGRSMTNTTFRWCFFTCSPDSFDWYRPCGCSYLSAGDGVCLFGCQCVCVCVNWWLAPPIVRDSFLLWPTHTHDQMNRQTHNQRGASCLSAYLSINTPTQTRAYFLLTDTYCQRWVVVWIFGVTVTTAFQRGKSVFLMTIAHHIRHHLVLFGIYSYGSTRICL